MGGSLKVQDFEGVSLLNSNGDNFWCWELQMETSAQSEAAEDILYGLSERPPSTPTPVFLPTPVYKAPAEDKEEEAALTSYNKCLFEVAQANAQLKLQWTAQQEIEAKWAKQDAKLRLILINTLPQGVMDAVRSKKTASGMFLEVKRLFKEQGLTEECTTWGDFFKLRCGDCTSTSQFIEKFQAGLSHLEELELSIPSKGKVYQFINAIEDQYPEYAKQCRHDLCQKHSVTIDKMIHEINDEAKSDDPVKKPALAIKALGKNVEASHAPLSSQKEGSRAALREDLSGMTKLRLQTRIPLEASNNNSRKRPKRLDTVPLTVISADGTPVNSLHKAEGFDISDSGTLHVSHVRSLRLKISHAIQDGINQVNESLIDTEVTVSEEATLEAVAQGKEGIVVECLYTAAAVRPTVDKQKMAMSLPRLWLLIPPTYPYTSPSYWNERMDADDNLSLNSAAREEFSRKVRTYPAPVSLRTMAACWDTCARDTVVEHLTLNGGGTMSSSVGVWETYVIS